MKHRVTLRRKIFLLFSIVGLVLALLWFVLLGGGPEPLEVVASEPQDVIVSVDRPVDLLLGVRDFLLAAGVAGAAKFRDIPPAWLLKLAGANGTAALGARFVPERPRQPAFLVALKAGRVSHLAALPFAGEKPLDLEDARLYRYGSLFVLQGGPLRAVKVGEKPDFLPEAQICAFARPSRIAEVLGMTEQLRQLDALRVPWPLETLTLGAGFSDGILRIDADGRYSQSGVGSRAAMMQREAPLPPLAADYFDSGRTVLALSWFAPDGREVRTALEDLTPPDPVVAGRYQAALSRFVSGGLRSACGKRAAFLVARQDNRVQPGYPGIGFVQELRRGHGLKDAVREFLSDATGVIVQEGAPAPARFPYFEGRRAGGGLPPRYVLYSEMLRPSEGYQPLVAVTEDRLIYASSEAMLRIMLGTEGLEDQPPCHAWLRFVNQGGEAFDQLDGFSCYVLEEELACRGFGEVLRDTTDYKQSFREVRGILERLDEIRLEMTCSEPGSITVTARIAPKEADNGP